MLTNRVGKCLVWFGFRSAEGTIVGATERMPPPMPPITAHATHTTAHHAHATAHHAHAAHHAHISD